MTWIHALDSLEATEASISMDYKWLLTVSVNSFMDRNKYKNKEKYICMPPILILVKCCQMSIHIMLHEFALIRFSAPNYKNCWGLSSMLDYLSRKTAKAGREGNL